MPGTGAVGTAAGVVKKNVRAPLIGGRDTRTTRRQMDYTDATTRRQIAAENRVRELSRLGDDLLQATEGTDLTTTELLRAEATRLNAAAFGITTALAPGDVPTAYRLSLIDADHARGARVA